MSKEPTRVVAWSSLEEGRPVRAEIEGVQLVVVRLSGEVHVLHGCCPHRGADLAFGSIEGTEIVCADHGWGFDCSTGESEAIAGAAIHRFRAWIDETRDEVMMDAVEARAFAGDQVGAFAYALD